MTKLVLWDFDGTMSDDRHRRDLYHEKRYAEYFGYEQQMADPPYPEAMALYAEMKLEGWEMAYLTARLERNRPATEDWIRKHGLDIGAVFMRPEAMNLVRPPKFKSQIVGRLIASGEYERVVLVDNDPLVVERIKEDHGEEHIFFASWDQNPEMSSIQNVQAPAL